MSLSPLFPTSAKAERLFFFSEKSCNCLNITNMLGAYFYVSFATQKRKIISEGTQRALKPLVVLLTLSTQSKMAETLVVFKRV